MKRTIVIAAAITVGLVACGGDSDSGGSDLSDAQAGAAAAAIEQAESGGIELDESCVNDIAAQLSDDDAAKVVAAGAEGDAELSAEGEALGVELLSCADEEALADLFITGLSESGQSFDEDCVREQLEGFDVTELAAASQGGEPPAELISSLVECLDLGG
jgi:hypothetical protein